MRGEIMAGWLGFCQSGQMSSQNSSSQVVHTCSSLYTASRSPFVPANAPMWSPQQVATTTLWLQPWSLTFLQCPGMTLIITLAPLICWASLVSCHQTLNPKFKFWEDLSKKKTAASSSVRWYLVEASILSIMPHTGLGTGKSLSRYVRWGWEGTLVLA